ncbi:hypothetical protein [Bacillus sp. V33-4]|uniref:hypothetical protein n=1 Tax=Bacillus sp. V33-4 TaxID=2054169 RepID=UPI000C783B24|nr:hypothetical protein [Bacillus sp. V33-4]PLR83650.1 hypothetical protein CVD23_13500 [Bacillus sp. V33-4]
MKKLAIGILSAAFIFGAGTYAFAQANNDGEGTINFGQMKPKMEEMHPDLSEKELKDMYDSCHGNGGTMREEKTDNMMNDNNSMMNNL